MAGSARYTIILDANVLYPNLLRDILLSLAVAGLYHARWTQRIHEEWTRNLGANRPDLDDRHVLAAAIAGHADAIVTANLRDFPKDALAKYNIEAQHPDDFIMNQLGLRAFEALEAIKRVRERMKNPPRSTSEFVELIKKAGLPQTEQFLRARVGLI